LKARMGVHPDEEPDREEKGMDKLRENVVKNILRCERAKWVEERHLKGTESALRKEKKNPKGDEGIAYKRFLTT